MPRPFSFLLWETQILRKTENKQHVARVSSFGVSGDTLEIRLQWLCPSQKTVRFSTLRKIKAGQRDLKRPGAHLSDICEACRLISAKRWP